MAKKKKKKKKQPDAPKPSPPAEEKPRGDAAAPSSDAPSGKKKDDEEQPRSPAREAWHLIRGVALALLIALAIRRFAVEAYKIPTSSMEPTLIGHEDYGDRVVTFKPGSSEPERWAVHVFRPPRDPNRNYIKRVVGLPGEIITIYGGDIYVDGVIARKPDTMQQDVWHRVYALKYDPYHAKALPAAAAAEIDTGAPIDAGLAWQPSTPQAADAWHWQDQRELVGRSDAPAWLGYRFPIKNLYVRPRNHWLFCDEDGQSQDGRKPVERFIDTARLRVRCADGTVLSQAETLQQIAHRQGFPHAFYPSLPSQLRDVPDIKLQTRARLDDGTLLLRLDNAAGSYDAIFQPDGQVQLKTPDGKVLEQVQADFDDGTQTLSFARRDWSLEVEVNGNEVLEHHLTAPDVNAVGSPEPLTPTRPAIGVRGGTVRLQAITLLRDLYYLPLAAYQPDKVPRTPNELWKGGRLGEALGDEPVLQQWLVSVDHGALRGGRPNLIAEGEMILELQTDRGNAVLEMPFRGWIAAQHVRPGDTIDLDAPLLTIVPAQTGRMREVRYHVRGDNPRDIPLPLIASHQVGEDGYFFLGDNSPASQDGRVWGDVVRRNLVGEAHVVFWPLSRWRMIR